MKYLSLMLFLSGCCTYDIKHARDMFAKGAEGYCVELWAKEMKNDKNKYYKDKCFDVYSRYRKAF